ncbi:alanine racemase [Geodermatophilus sp. DSM 45219]|uniref:alanine racemase n=1 Tax=Geodermatophilus sp. DSM 45219 TaxID=1881103 RepID=UPI00088CE9D0|nr:alanine racemase [Geodermatophilus sp. DSM 45219]SDN74577.1 diaminopimelate decarboxylase [Geodermatophilus sp. DSM 45219]
MLSPPSAAGSGCAHALPPTVLPPGIPDLLRASARTGTVSGYVYDPLVAAGRARALRAVLPAWASLFFAAKANGFPAVLAALAGPGGVDGFEVASRAEADAARAALLAAGRSPRLLAAGPAKTPALLGALLDAGTEVVHAESPLELARLSALAEARSRTVRVGLRVNPAAVGVRGTLAMGGRPAPFGVPEPDVPEVLALARSLPGLDVVGFHVHAVCGNRDARAHAAYVAWCLDWAARTAREHRVDLRWVDVGGGLGVAYGGEAPLDLDLLGEELHRLAPPAGVEVALEPGRWLAADCGWYAAEVVDVKRSYGTAYVLVRGGIGGFALPGTEDFPFPLTVLPVEDWPSGLPRPELRDVPVTVVGELCTPEDVLVRDVVVDRVRAGDLVVVPQAGAYGWEFALQSFLGHPPATRDVVPAPGADVPPAPPVLVPDLEVVP